MNSDLTVSQYLNQDVILESIKQTLGNKAPQFIASVSSLAASNKALAACDKKSLMSACLIAASLDLPINQNLGFAYIIPYNKNTKSKDEKTGKELWIKETEAQFQMGWKGFVQLAQRSGQYKTINVTDIREGELAGKDRLSGELSYNWVDDEDEREKLKVVGYVAHFELLNGFRKTYYMTVEKLENHAKKYSQAYRSDRGGMNPWKDDFDSMARKTVLKLLLGKYGVMTVEMQKAVVVDQSVEEEYPDNKPQSPEEVASEKEKARILNHIEKATTADDLHEVIDLVEEYGLTETLNKKLASFNV